MKKYPPALVIVGVVVFCAACWWAIVHGLFMVGEADG